MTGDDIRKDRLLAEVDSLERIVANRGRKLHHMVVMKLARRVKDPVYRKYFLQAADPKRICDRLEVIRDQARHDQLDAADSAMRLLRVDLDYVTQELERPHRLKVAKAIEDGHKGGPKGGRNADRNRKMALEFQQLQAKEAVKRKHGHSARSDTDLMKMVGARENADADKKRKSLGRSAAIAAIQDGLKKLSG